MSDEPETVTLALIIQSLNRLSNEVSAFRDDLNVLAAVVQRMDNSQTRILEEVRTIHAQQRTAR